MVKSEYIIKNVVDNEHDPMLLELESIGYGNTLFVELNENTITHDLLLHMIKVYFDSPEVPKVDLNSSDAVFSAAARHYLSLDDGSELRTTIEFDENDYIIKSIVAIVVAD